MDSSTQSILFGILLYILYVLIPLIPAVLIYKLFPDSEVGANGLLGNLKINTTGAFAAYIIVVILGFSTIRHIQGLIDSKLIQNSAWEVEGQVIFHERNDQGEWTISNDITDQNVKDKLDIRTNPNYNQKDLSAVNFITYSINKLPKITFSFPGFGSHTIDLNDNEIEVNTVTKTITLKEIILQKDFQEYKPDTSDTQGVLIPFGGPPTTSNN